MRAFTSSVLEESDPSTVFPLTLTAPAKVAVPPAFPMPSVVAAPAKFTVVATVFTTFAVVNVGSTENDAWLAPGDEMLANGDVVLSLKILRPLAPATALISDPLTTSASVVPPPVARVNVAFDATALRSKLDAEAPERRAVLLPPRANTTPEDVVLAPIATELPERMRD